MWPIDSPTSAGEGRCTEIRWAGTKSGKELRMRKFILAVAAAAAIAIWAVPAAACITVIKFAGTPGQPNCYGQSVAALAQQYKGFSHAADALAGGNNGALQDEIRAYCANFYI